jgi:hypothetical protein
LELAISIEYLNGVFTVSRRADARRQEGATIGSECKPSREWDDLWRKVRNGGSVKAPWNNQNGAQTTGAHVVAPIGSEDSSARVECVGPVSFSTRPFWSRTNTRSLPLLTRRLD